MRAGEVLIFRPELNAKRFAESCERMCMPEDQ
jgi:branched-subunit amino acid aminotransferase/4-amino-4-deoxychorismate lyase